MTNEEIICTWMEPKPKKVPAWWWRDRGRWSPRDLTLDRLHEVEARLSEEQWLAYISSLVMLLELLRVPLSVSRRLVSLSAEQKIAALAAVLRPEVESNAENH